MSIPTPPLCGTGQDRTGQDRKIGGGRRRTLRGVESTGSEHSERGRKLSLLSLANARRQISASEPDLPVCAPPFLRQGQGRHCHCHHRHTCGGIHPLTTLVESYRGGKERRNGESQRSGLLGCDVRAASYSARCLIPLPPPSRIDRVATPHRLQISLCDILYVERLRSRAHGCEEVGLAKGGDAMIVRGRGIMVKRGGAMVFTMYRACWSPSPRIMPFCAGREKDTRK